MEAWMAEDESGYSEEETGRLELIWGDGFLSPGGPEEVGRILGGQDVSGCDVLDIGSGPGGADIALVREHGAARVVGVDVQQDLVETAAARAAAAGLGDRISYQVIEPGPLPFPDASFDVVFSKDSIIHVEDKKALYAETLRVLRLGGRLLVGDWLRGSDEKLTAQVKGLVELAGHTFTMATLSEIAAIVATVGFEDIQTEDRRSWYLGEASKELQRLQGELGRELEERWGEDAASDEIAFWETLVACLTTGALSPGHIRAQKPPPHSDLM
jgi:SAM-dependent methyltransferase